MQNMGLSGSWEVGGPFLGVPMKRMAICWGMEPTIMMIVKEGEGMRRF